MNDDKNGVARTRRAPLAQPLDAARNPEALLRLATVQSLTGLGKTTIYRLASRGEFPQPVRPTERSVRWRSHEVEEWMRKRRKRKGAKGGAP